uniref:Thioredoxin domain-containing protein n=1 Tax=viral metagenome TaxID=1070528 RepID=A0A6C0I232_9ZZZZ
MSISAKSVKTTLETIYSKRHILVMLLVACLFIWIGAYVYNTYVSSYLGSSLEGYASSMGENAPPSSENQKTATLYMFGTSWCPHCKTAKPIWDDYVSNNENLKVGNYDILFKSVDCDAEKNIADKFNVKGYPTFKLERGPGDIVEFEAKPTHDNFTSLLQTSLT